MPTISFPEANVASDLDSSDDEFYGQPARQNIPKTGPANSISFGSPHARPMWALGTCGEPNDIKTKIHPVWKIVPLLLLAASWV